MSTTPLPPSIDVVCIGAVEVMHYSAHVSLWRLYEQMGIPHEHVTMEQISILFLRFSQIDLKPIIVGA